MMRTMLVDGLANVRDLGGLAREDRTMTPHGVFLRAEMLDRVTAAGWDRLRAHGIGTVIDLRRPEERSGSVPADIDRVFVDLDGDDRTFWAPREADGRWGTPLYYEDHLSVLPDRMRAVLEAISAARPGGVLFHCGAGWDRTGLVAAVLLRAIGTRTDDACTDYLLSYENAAAAEALHARPSHVELRRSVLDRFGHTPESAFRQMYDALDLPAWTGYASLSPVACAALFTWRGAVAA